MHALTSWQHMWHGEKISFVESLINATVVICCYLQGDIMNLVFDKMLHD